MCGNNICFQDWYSISGKGCFYFDLEQEYPSSCGHEGRLIKCHHYYLTLPVSTSVWVEAEVASPGVQVTDVLLFVCQVNDQEEATDVITYTQHKIGTVRMYNTSMCIMYMCVY